MQKSVIDAQDRFPNCPSHDETPTEQTMPNTIYKVLGQEAWQTAQQQPTFAGAAIDLTDGYIHFSTKEQVAETVAKHFADRTDLVLVAVNIDALDDLRWEPSRGGALFPHLYGEMPLSAVRWAVELPLGKDGAHVFPDTM